jgi:uncharacterized protein YegL
MNELVLRRQELVENPTARVPVCLCLDVSYSMSGQPINELNEGIQALYEAIKGDDIARYSAEISIVTFGGVAKQIADFCSIDRQQIGRLNAEGGTPMGDAVVMALDLLEQRKREYQDAGVDYFQPWLVLMTDGQPTTSNISWEDAANRTAALANSRKLSVFAIGVGSEADMGVLARFSPRRTPLRLQGLRFVEFFEWLSQSVTAVSNSTPGQDVPLPEVKGWGSV